MGFWAHIPSISFAFVFVGSVTACKSKLVRAERTDFVRKLPQKLEAGDAPQVFFGIF